MTPDRAEGGPDRPHRGDDVDLGMLLRAEADSHHPDMARVRQRIRAGLAGEPVETAPSPVRRLHGWVVPAVSAAAAVAVVAAVVAVGNREDGSVTVPAQQPTTQDAPATPTASETPLPSPSETPLPATEAPAPPTSDSSAATTASALAPGELTIDLRPAVAGEVVELDDSARDWVVAGYKVADGTARRGTGEQELSGPHRTGNAQPSVVPGPFALRWSGGMPDRSGATSDWSVLTVPAGSPPSGARWQVEPTGAPQTLALYVAAVGRDGTVQVRFGDAVRTLPLSADVVGHVVTVRFHGRVDGPEVEVSVLAADGASVALAAGRLSDG